MFCSLLSTQLLWGQIIYTCKFNYISTTKSLQKKMLKIILKICLKLQKPFEKYLFTILHAVLQNLHNWQETWS